MQVYVYTHSFGSLCAQRSVNPRGNASACTPAKPETVATPDLAVRLSGGRHVTRQRSGLGLVGPQRPGFPKAGDKCEGPVKIGFVCRPSPAPGRTQVPSSYCLTSLRFWLRSDTFQPSWVRPPGVSDFDLAGRAGAGGCRRSRCIQIVKEPIQLMSVSDIQDHFCAPEAAFSEIALCSVAFLSPRAPLLRIHWPLATVLSLPPHQRGQVVRRLFPAGYCHPPTTELPKTERDPILTSGPSIFSMTPKFSMLANQAISSDKSLRFSPIAAADRRPFARALRR